MSRSIFITATDTDAGKTWVTRHLLELGLEQGLDIQALKPIASGVQPSGLNEDVAVLLECQKKSNADQINFHTYKTPVTPALAAQYEAYTLEADRLVDWVCKKTDAADVTLIEGVGGLMVPLITNQEQTWLVSDWLQATAEADVLLVAPLRLGCMNHVLLSCTLLANMNRLPKWIVLNDIDGNKTGEETRRIITPFLNRIFGNSPEILCIRHPGDLASIM